MLAGLVSSPAKPAILELIKKLIECIYTYRLAVKMFNNKPHLVVSAHKHERKLFLRAIDF